MTAEPSNAAGSAVPPCFVAIRQRDPPFFTGLRGEDVEEWLDDYNRVSTFNRWDDIAKLANVNFYLDKVAKTWFFNNKASITDWADFTAQLRRSFGTPAARSDGAKKALETRVQQAQETYTAYIQDVIALCRRVDNDMTEADQVRHIIKGIGHFAFTALALQNPSTVADVTTICRRLDEMQSIRLQQETALPQYLGDDNLRTLIRAIIREELRDYGAACAPGVHSGPPATCLRDIVREELAAMPVPSSPPAPAPVMMPSYSDVAARPPLPLAPVMSPHAAGCVAAVPPALGPRSPYPMWRSPRQDAPFGRPVCYYCGIRGHISRFCRRRQQDERRGYDTYERDNTRFSYGYRQRDYSPPTRRPSSPPDSADPSRNSRNPRRRSPSPFRRAVSPLRPVSHDPNHPPEN